MLTIPVVLTLAAIAAILYLRHRYSHLTYVNRLRRRQAQPLAPYSGPPLVEFAPEDVLPSA